MGKQIIKEQAGELVKDVIRKSESAHSGAILAGIPDLIDSVKLDRDKMRMRVEALLNKKTGNPINALLGLMGMRIVNIQKTAEEYVEHVECIDSANEFDDNPPSTLRNMMTICDEQFMIAAEKMAAHLYRIEQKYEEDAQDYRNQIARLINKLNVQEQAHNQLLADYTSLKKNVLTSLQQFLSEVGPQGTSLEAKIASELLEDMGAKVYWTAKDAPFSESAMFVILRFDDPEKLQMKPCIADDDSVLIKGVKFIAAQESQELAEE